MFFVNFTECPELKKPKNGKKYCRKVAGQMRCIMSCHEGHSFSAEVVTSFTCGPDTEWKWNGMADLNELVCLST